MSNNKFYQVEKEINGKTYVAQFQGLSTALKGVDSTYINGSSNTSTEKFSQYIFDNIIMEPKGLTIDDFESIEELNEVVAFGREVMQGHFRDEKDKKPDKGAGK